MVCRLKKSASRSVPKLHALRVTFVATRCVPLAMVRTMQRQGSTLVLTAPGTGNDVELGTGDDYVVLGVLAGVVRSSPRETNS